MLNSTAKGLVISTAKGKGWLAYAEVLPVGFSLAYPWHAISSQSPGVTLKVVKAAGGVAEGGIAPGSSTGNHATPLLMNQIRDPIVICI